MNDRMPHEAQSAAPVLIILGVLFFVGVVFLSALGFIGFQVYSARRAAMEARVIEDRARAVAREKERQANEAFRQAELAKQAEEQAARMQKIAAENERRSKAREEMEAQQRLQAELNEAEQRNRQRQAEVARLKLAEAEAAWAQLLMIQKAFQAWSASTTELTLMPNSSGNGKQLSWRVHLLPYMGEEQLYKQFHLSEPWDSEHNLALVNKMPAAYGSKPGETRFRSYLQVDGESPILASDVTDGLIETALLFWVGEDHAVPWTKPDSLSLKKEVASADVRIDVPSSSQPDANGLVLLRADGRVARISQADDKLVNALNTVSGGEFLNTLELSQDRRVDRVFIADTVKSTVAQAEPSEEEIQKNIRSIAGAINRLIEAMKTPNVQNEVMNSQLSWRVHLLPYLGEEKLYLQFHQHESWFSKHNLQLIEQMPVIYGLGATGGRSRVHAYFAKVDERGFPAGLLIPDLDLRTQVCLFYCAPQNAAPWTASKWLLSPQAIGLNKSLGWPGGKSIVGGLADGNAIVIPSNLHPSKMRALMMAERKPSFNLDAALAEPQLPLRSEVAIKPAEAIAGLYQIPEVPVPAGGLKSPVALEPNQQKRIRTLGIAMHEYYSTFRSSPVTKKRPNGTLSELSWRVHVLPMIEQGALYEKFALDEPWDSPTNKKLIEFMPEAFQNIPGKTTETSLHVLTGEASLLGGQKNWMAATDGLQNAIMLMDLPAKFAVPWTQPEQHNVAGGLSFKELSGGKSLPVVMGDGSYASLSEIPDNLFLGLATGSGGEIIDAQTIIRWSAAKRGEFIIAPPMRKRWEQNQMKQIAMAILNFESTFRRLPPARNNNPNGIVPPEAYQLSWRVHILPYLGYTNLYNQFRLAEPWDSPHNKQLIKCMPDCFRDATDSPTSTETRIMSFSGIGTLFPEVGDSPKLSQISDGISSTIGFFQAPPNQTVPWTKPEDFEIDVTSVTTATPALSKLRNALGIDFALLDGSVLTIPPDYPPEKLHALITPRGGEIVNVSDVRN